MYITKTIMKLVLLDNVRAQETAAAQHYKKDGHNISHYSDSYRYLDELLDKTFVTDYFMERNAGANHESSGHNNK